MSVFDMARDLGTAILCSQEGVRLLSARSVFDEDTEAQLNLNLYKESAESLRQKMSSADASKVELNELTAKLALLETALKNYPVTGELIDAENCFNRLVNQVIAVLKATITGDSEDCSSCGSSCASCHSCE